VNKTAWDLISRHCGYALEPGVMVHLIVMGQASLRRGPWARHLRERRSWHEDRHAELQGSKSEGQTLTGDSRNFSSSRSRLMDFQTHCHPMDILGTCTTEQSRCLRAYLGLIGKVGAWVGNPEVDHPWGKNVLETEP
jgi:hypothetical protein